MTASKTLHQSQPQGSAVKGDDDLTLRTDTLALLDTFYHERDLHTKAFEDLRLRASQDDGEEQDGDAAPLAANISIDAFPEDWQASQFWYTPATAHRLASALVSPPTPQHIAVISTPSVYLALLSLLSNPPWSSSKKETRKEKPTIHLLEFDPRFALLPNYISYDYNKPLVLPSSFTNHFDAVIVDPPFLSEECQGKTAVTVMKVAQPGARVMVSTGRVMGLVVEKLYEGFGVGRRGFEPRHAKGLGNEFGVWANLGDVGALDGEALDGEA